MVFQLIGRSIKLVFKQPLRLLGLTAFAALLEYLAYVLFAGVPGVAYVASALIGAALAWLYLRSFRGEECKTADMFAVCKDGATFKRVLCGVAWKDLWVLIWGLIPFAGVVFAVMKRYEYRFVPYLLMDRPELNAAEALKLSSEKTKGYRVRMFLSDLLICGVCCVVMLTLSPIASVLLYEGFIGASVVYLLFAALIMFVLSVFIVLLQNALGAVFYEEAEHPTPKPVREVPTQDDPNKNYRFCQNCGHKYEVGDARFCPKCGNPLDE